MTSRHFVSALLASIATTVVACDASPTDEGDEDRQEETSTESAQGATACTWVQRSEYSTLVDNLCGHPAYGGGVSGLGRAYAVCYWSDCVSSSGKVVSRSAKQCHVPTDAYGCPTMGCQSGSTCVMWGRCQDTTSCAWAP
jgi:hypothetical protein